MAFNHSELHSDSGPDDGAAANLIAPLQDAITKAAQ
jgi:hypothetical protein